MIMMVNHNEDKTNVVFVFDALHDEYKHMASWYDTFWKTYTIATLQYPLAEVNARIVDTCVDGGTITIAPCDDDDDGYDDDTSNITVIADVGCGTGEFLKRLFDEYNVSRDHPYSYDTFQLPSQSLKLIGIEPSGEMLRQAMTKFDKVHNMDNAGRRNNDDDGSNVTVVLDRCPAEQLPMDDNSVDIVVSTNAFHFFRNQQQSLREIQRVLKSSNSGAHIDGGGTLILTDWCNDYIFVRLYHFMERLRWNWIYRYTDAYPSPLRREELAELVEAAGLCIHKHVAYRVRVFSVFFWGMQSVVATKR